MIIRKLLLAAFTVLALGSAAIAQESTILDCTDNQTAADSITKNGGQIIFAGTTDNGKSHTSLFIFKDMTYLIAIIGPTMTCIVDTGRVDAMAVTPHFDEDTNNNGN